MVLLRPIIGAKYPNSNPLICRGIRSEFPNCGENRAQARSREKAASLTLSWITRQKKRPQKGALLFGGGPGIRTPGTSRFNGFQDRRFRPLSQPTRNCHLPLAGQAWIIQSCNPGTRARGSCAGKRQPCAASATGSSVFVTGPRGSLLALGTTRVLCGTAGC